MTEFDAIKALKEEVMGLLEIKGVLLKEERSLQIEYGEMEVRLNSVTRLRGFADAEIARKRDVLKKLEG